MAQVCHLNDIRFLIVCAISDSAAENSVKEFKRSLEKSVSDAARVVLGVLDRARR